MQLKKPIGDRFWRGIDLLVMERSIRMTFKDVVLEIGSAVVYDLSAVRHLHREEQARVLRKRCPSSTLGVYRGIMPSSLFLPYMDSIGRAGNKRLPVAEKTSAVDASVSVSPPI
jgi:hypothetical protein